MRENYYSFALMMPETFQIVAKLLLVFGREGPVVFLRRVEANKA